MTNLGDDFGPRPAPSDRRPPRSLPPLVEKLAVPMLVAVIALGGTFLGYQASIRTLDTQVAIQLGVEQRAKKADSYFGFLTANYAYFDRFPEFRDCVSAARKSPDPSKTAGATCVPAVQTLVTAQQDLRKALDQVAVYGSDNATAYAILMFNNLPGVDETSMPDLVEIEADVISADYWEARTGFRRAVCFEVPVTPREHC